MLITQLGTTNHDKTLNHAIYQLAGVTYETLLCVLRDIVGKPYIWKWHEYLQIIRIIEKVLAYESITADVTHRQPNSFF